MIDDAQADAFCTHTKTGYGRLISTDGHVHVVRCCLGCMQRVHSMESVKKDQVREEGHVIEELPIIQDFRGVGEECEVRGCTSTNTQLHHWAPRRIFGDEADDWPTSWLCVERHHPLWHAMVTSRRFRAEA